MQDVPMWMIIAMVLVVVLLIIPMIATRFLRDVEKGEIRIVSWLQGSKVIYRGPCKSKEIPLLTVGATIPSMAINVDLDITDQTSDRDEDDKPKKKVEHEIGQDLTLLSVEELGLRVQLLHDEINRLEADMAQKRASRTAADQFFKR